MIGGLGILLVGCSSSADNGQTGSPGYSCPDSCEANALDTVEWFNKVPPSVTFTGASCVAGTGKDFTGDDFCRCLTTGADVDLSPALPCFGPRLRGGFCMAPSSETPSCSVGNDAACNASCEKVEAAMLADAQRPADAKLRSARCKSDGGPCDYVVSIGGRCYRNDRAGFLVEPSYDCALSDEEITSSPLPMSSAVN